MRDLHARLGNRWQPGSKRSCYHALSSTPMRVRGEVSQAVSTPYSTQHEDKFTATARGMGKRKSFERPTFAAKVRMLQRISLWLLFCACLAVLLSPLQSHGHLIQRGGTANATKPALPDLYEATIAELQDGLSKGLFTSVDLITVR